MQIIWKPGVEVFDRYYLIEISQKFEFVTDFGQNFSQNTEILTNLQSKYRSINCYSDNIRSQFGSKYINFDRIQSEL